jgi:hypothetical protein
MAGTHLQGVEGEDYAPVAPRLGLPNNERREWLTRLLEATEKALAEMGDPTSQPSGTMAKDLADLEDRLQAELAILRRDEWADRLLPR